MNNKIRVLSVLLLIVAATSVLLIPVQAQDDTVLTLATAGPYVVGRMEITFEGAYLEEDDLHAIIWYPAIMPDNPNLVLFERYGYYFNAEPDQTAAPYPMIVYSNTIADMDHFDFLKTHFASWGFIVVSILHPDEPFDITHIPRITTTRTLSTSNLLDQLTMSNFAELIDFEAVGVAGYGVGGYTALVAAGAQIDPLHYLEYCANPSPGPSFRNPCTWALEWDEVVAHRAAYFDIEMDQLWPPEADERVKAIMPIHGWGGPLFGPRGLAQVSVPTLIMGSTNDKTYLPYDSTMDYVYQNLSVSDRYLLSFIDQGHMYAPASTQQPPINHFATAFFGLYLQGHDDYANYLTAGFVSEVTTEFDFLAWGPLEDQ